MQSFMLNNIEPGTIHLRQDSLYYSGYLKDIGQSVSTGEFLLISICLLIIFFAPSFIGSKEDRLYRSLNSERLRAEKVQELREDFPIFYPIISTVTLFTLKVVVALLNKTYDTLVETKEVLNDYVKAINKLDKKMQTSIINLFKMNSREKREEERE